MIEEVFGVNESEEPDADEMGYISLPLYTIMRLQFTVTAQHSHAGTDRFFRINQQRILSISSNSLIITRRHPNESSA